MQNDRDRLPDRSGRHLGRGLDLPGSMDEESETAIARLADPRIVGRETASPALTHLDIPIDHHRFSPRKLPRSPTDAALWAGVISLTDRAVRD